VAPGDIERARRFVVEDLLKLPPETLEPCYVTDWERGAVLVSIEAETSSARITLAETAPPLAATLAEEADLADCAPLIPSEIAAELGDSVSERVTIAMVGDPAAFEPSDVTIEGALVTVVLTFRNDSDSEQTLTFADPLDSTTGPVAPGDIRLIVVRELQAGEYPFFSETDPDGLRGTIRIESPTFE